MINLNYTIKDVIVQPLENGLSDVVKSITINLTFTNENNNSFNYDTIVTLDTPSESFTPFEDLTQEQVIQWCENKIFQGPESKESVMNRMQIMLANAPVNKKPTSWEVTE
jgi:hypothetical protein